MSLQHMKYSRKQYFSLSRTELDIQGRAILVVVPVLLEWRTGSTIEFGTLFNKTATFLLRSDLCMGEMAKVPNVKPNLTPKESLQLMV